MAEAPSRVRRVTGKAAGGPTRFRLCWDPSKAGRVPAKS